MSNEPISVIFQILLTMKKNALLTIALLLPVFLFSQKPFAPLGAKWGGHVQCSPTFFPCPPNYPYYYDFEVTEDTIIQGKYCTLIKDLDWASQNQRTIIHQDSHQIYRYDRVAEDFKLVLDFSKDVGESWEIEAPPFWASNDTFTITVIEKDSTFRRVSISSGGSPILSDLPLYEGFGGLLHNKRLLISNRHFIIADPIIWDELTCYIDPDEGLLYGNASGCEPVSTEYQELENAAFIVYPNPASTNILLEHPSLKEVAHWNLSDALGRNVLSQSLLPASNKATMLVENLVDGIYFWNVALKGKIVSSGKIVVRH